MLNFCAFLECFDYWGRVDGIEFLVGNTPLDLRVFFMQESKYRIQFLEIFVVEANFQLNELLQKLLCMIKFWPNYINPLYMTLSNYIRLLYDFHLLVCLFSQWFVFNILFDHELLSIIPFLLMLQTTNMYCLWSFYRHFTLGNVTYDAKCDIWI